MTKAGAAPCRPGFFLRGPVVAAQARRGPGYIPDSSESEWYIERSLGRRAELQRAVWLFQR